MAVSMHGAEGHDKAHCWQLAPYGTGSAPLNSVSNNLLVIKNRVYVFLRKTWSSYPLVAPAVLDVGLVHRREVLCRQSNSWVASAEPRRLACLAREGCPCSCRSRRRRLAKGLPDELRNQFDRNGFIIVRDFLPDQQFRELQAQIFRANFQLACTSKAIRLPAE